MQQIETINELRNLRNAWRLEKKTVAFVPTMGNLHAGHLALVEKAKTLADYVVVSIFVNPMQFGQNEDLSTYPRTLEEDKAALAELGVNVVFTPHAEEVYPRGLAQQTQVEVPAISNILCGASRPGHFQGVATVVCKFFNMLQPEFAVFGKKDYQQLLVIKMMVADLSISTEIVGVDTKRNEDGLALSSRNGYLSTEQLNCATIIQKSLQRLSQALKNQQPLADAIAEARQDWVKHDIKPDYLEVRRQSDLLLPESTDQSLVILAAAYVGKTRLIDNLEVQL
ncbi:MULTISPECIES: pantoate--beta-alanine ligase [Gammaproteobacteria]|uniref:pantoate--beta-alanine ligase n=1 Tax=Gammaproteobacteria TaxID=1236 RepID=UPI000DCFB6AF|nr:MULTISPECIES: pantoate--beta-alanine ligase [Gammaproteobacteria]RTE85646.1 pantoate--beta-alanine ligase [Aliidiomarina sp. B3213]TCZ89615.1 pantoate--beta-alanine ligase [Lysobacter sp. N42]